MAKVARRLKNIDYVRQLHPEEVIGSVLGEAYYWDFGIFRPSMDQPLQEGAAYTDGQMSTSSFLGECHFPATL